VHRYIVACTFFLVDDGGGLVQRDPIRLAQICYSSRFAVHDMVSYVDEERNGGRRIAAEKAIGYHPAIISQPQPEPSQYQSLHECLLFLSSTNLLMHLLRGQRLWHSPRPMNGGIEDMTTKNNGKNHSAHSRSCKLLYRVFDMDLPDGMTSVFVFSSL
jgi:hypothetical protein